MDTIPVGTTPASPFGVGYDPANQDIYVGNAGTISVIDGSTNTVVTTINISGTAFAYDPTSNNMYVTSSGVIAVIDSSTNLVITTIPVAAGGITYDKANQDLYAATGPNTVTVIDPVTNTVITTIAVGSGPAGVAYDIRNKDVYVTENSFPTTNKVDVISTGS
jgi:YVTN family beta-propeller protein